MSEDHNKKAEISEEAGLVIIMPNNEEISLKPDYPLWMRMTYWSHNEEWHQSEAFLLTENIDPIQFNILKDKFSHTSYSDKSRPRLYRNGKESFLSGSALTLYEILGTSQESVLNKLEIIKRAIITEELKLLNIQNPEKPNSVYIDPHEFLRWISEKGISYPDEFDNFIEGSKTTTLQPYSDPKHPRYSSELDAAIRVWEAMFVQGKFDPTDKQYNLNTQIELWLYNWFNKRKIKFNRGTVTMDSAVKRIRTLVSEDEKIGGGRPKKHSYPKRNT